MGNVNRDRTHLGNCCLVAQFCPTLCDPHGLQLGQASLSFTVSWSLLKFMSIGSVMTSNHLNLCCPLLLLSSVFPSISRHIKFEDLSTCKDTDHWQSPVLEGGHWRMKAPCHLLFLPCSLKPFPSCSE